MLVSPNKIKTKTDPVDRGKSSPPGGKLSSSVDASRVASSTPAPWNTAQTIKFTAIRAHVMIGRLIVGLSSNNGNSMSGS